MANRYLRATGNWNGAVWASTSGGAAGSAATPTSADDVFISSNFTVTLVANTAVNSITHTNGGINLGSYALTIPNGGGFTSVGSTARSIDLGSGKLEITGVNDTGDTLLSLQGSNLTFNAGTSQIVLNAKWQYSSFFTLGKSFNDVTINLNDDGTGALSIVGAPTFRTLIIQSKNTAAHTVRLDDGATITVDKFIAIGSSSSNKLTIDGVNGSSFTTLPYIKFTDYSTSYGQYVDMKYVSATVTSSLAAKPYIGSNSTRTISSGATPFLTQDPPKAATLVDQLTTAPGSNTNWTVSGTVTQVSTGKDGGGYSLASGAKLTSTDTFDLLSSSLNFQTIGSTSLKFNIWGYSHSLTANKFYRVSLSGTTYLLQNSDDGASWSTVTSNTVDPNSYRSLRLEFEGAGTIGTVNTSFNQPPTTALNSPSADAVLTTTTPTLAFTATDPEGDQVQYQIQVGNSDFSTLHMDVTTTNYASGTQQTRVVSPALTEGSIDYWWRIRAKDPSGTNTWGAWSTSRKMTTAALPPTVTSGSSSSITTTTASVAGNVTADGGASITERGFVYATTSNPTTANSKKAVTGTTGSFNTSLTGLNPNTTYYWRAYATNSKGTSYGSNQSFTTEPRPPVVATGTSGGTSSGSFTVGGSSVTSNPDAQTISEFGIVYATTENPTIANSSQTGTGTTSGWSNSVSSLADSTTYYIRAYVKWGTNYAYGSQVSLTIPAPPAPPTVTTSAPSAIIDTRANITSNVTSAGDGTVTERGIVYGLTANPTLTDNKVTALTGGTGSYELRLTGLLPSTTYHYRAYAINENGTGYSSDSTFTTTAELLPDTGDGYWTYSSSGSTAVVSRSQATEANASVNLPLENLPQIVDGKTYTLHVGDITSDFGDPVVKLLYYSGASPVTQTLTANSSYTFTYDLTTYSGYYLQLFVTQGAAEPEPLTATFNDLYLAQEATFSEFVEFTPRGVTEVKIINNEIVDDRREAVIQSIYDKLIGYSYTPFEAQTEGLGYFEIYDGIDITDGTDTVTVLNLENKLTIDGGISETLKGTAPDKTETEYSRAGNIKKLISNTTLKVDKQRQEIEALVADVYDNDGYIEEKFSQVYQDIGEVRTTVQGAGGVNLIRNSVMYAYNNLGYPESWTTTHVDGEGSTITIQGSPESKTAGGISGNIFTLKGTKVVQNVPVRKDTDSIPSGSKTYYSFNVKVKKNLVGTAYIKLSNRQETHQIDLPTGEDYFWENFSINGLLPQDGYYDIEIYSDADAAAQFTDAMLSIGEYTHSWTQAPGEIGNASVSVTEDGITLRQDQFRYNYTHIDALGFNVHKKVLGTQEQIFGFNSDETNVSAIKSDKHIKMGGLMVVPITIDGESGWAWTPSGE